MRRWWVTVVVTGAACGGGGGGGSATPDARPMIDAQAASPDAVPPDAQPPDAAPPDAQPPDAAPDASPALVPFRELGKLVLPNDDAAANPRRAVGDVNGDGRDDFVLRCDPVSAFDPDAAEKKPTSPVRFFVQTESGLFTDATATFTPDPLRLINVARTRGADFNADGKLDAVFAASGPDPYVDGVPMGELPGDKARVLRSGAGAYAKVTADAAEPQFLHSVCIGDITGDGKPDAFMLSLFSKSYFLINDGQGDLTVDYARLPPDVLDQKKHEAVLSTYDDGFWKEWIGGIWTSCQLVDANRDGKRDLLILTGGMPYHALYLNGGGGDFSNSTLIKVPNGIGYGAGTTFGVHTEGTQTYTSVGSDGGIFLDSLLMDVNKDGHEDVITIATRRDSKGSEFIYYRGTRIQILLNTPGSFAVDTGNRILGFTHEPALNFTHYDTIESFDLDADGDRDLLVSRSTESQFENDGAPSTRFLFNDGNNVFTDVTAQMYLPRGTYFPISLGGKVGLVRIVSLFKSYDPPTNHFEYDLELTSFVSSLNVRP